MLWSGAGNEGVSLASRVARKPFLSADVGGRHVLMSVERGLYVSLDEAGKTIWQHLEQAPTIAALCEQLASDYIAPDRSVLERDVVTFLRYLNLHALVEITP